MPKAKVFGSPDLAKAMKKAFGSKTKAFTLEIKYQREVGDFVRKIEDAHRQAAESKLVFKT